MNEQLLSLLTLPRLQQIAEYIKKEIIARIIWSDSDNEEARFAKCEDAWAWVASRKREESHRRDRNKRREITWAAYCGVTLFGSTYGAALHGKGILAGENMLADMSDREVDRWLALNLPPLRREEYTELWERAMGSGKFAF